MKKTVGTLCIGDSIYNPSVDVIEYLVVTDIKKDKSGIFVGSDSHYYTAIKYCVPAAHIATKLNIDDRVFFVRIEDAHEEQRILRLKKLKSLQNKVNESLSELGNFIDKYFKE